jgi:hypothetical protein
LSEKINISNVIIAVITKIENKGKIAGGAPVFFVNNEDELENISVLLAQSTLSMVHDLGNGTKIIVKH